MSAFNKSFYTRGSTCLHLLTRRWCYFTRMDCFFDLSLSLFSCYNYVPDNHFCVPAFFLYWDCKLLFCSCTSLKLLKQLCALKHMAANLLDVNTAEEEEWLNSEDSKHCKKLMNTNIWTIYLNFELLVILAQHCLLWQVAALRWSCHTT